MLLMNRIGEKVNCAKKLPKLPNASKMLFFPYWVTLMSQEPTDDDSDEEDDVDDDDDVEAKTIGT